MPNNNIIIVFVYRKTDISLISLNTYSVHNMYLNRYFSDRLTLTVTQFNAS